MLSQAQAMQQVIQAAERFVKSCADATDAQWRHRPDVDPHAWSIGDVTEHVTIANGNVLRRLQGIGQHPLNGKPVSIDDNEMPYLFYRGDEPPNVATPTGLIRSMRTWNAHHCRRDMRA